MKFSLKRTLLFSVTYSDSLNIDLETLRFLVMGDKYISELWYVMPCVVLFISTTIHQKNIEFTLN